VLKRELWVAVLAALEFAQCLFVALKSGLTNPVARLSVVVLYALADGVCASGRNRDVKLHRFALILH
jgi:hypothetical protein